MLPKINRLKKKKDIERVFKKGKVFKEDFLILKVVKNDLKNSRFAFIVSQKVSKKAVLRNKIRRRLSELIRRYLFIIYSGLDIVIMAVPGLEQRNFWEIEETINKLFIKSKINPSPGLYTSEIRTKKERQVKSKFLIPTVPFEHRGRGQNEKFKAVKI